MSDSPETPAPAPVAAPVEAAPAPAPAPVQAAKPRPLNPWAKRAPAPAPAPVAPPPARVASTPEIAALSAQVDSMRTVIRAQADDALSGVAANIAATVRSIAGEDPAQQLAMLRTLRANGLVTSPAVIPAGASTMPASSPPATPPVATPASKDAGILAEHQRLASISPILAANFAHAHADALSRARASSRN